MRPSNENIEYHLNLFPEVRWDRFTETDTEFDIYGWIARDDGRSDFILFEVTPSKTSDDWNWWFCTSSAKYSHEFDRRLDPKNDAKGHVDCERVESLGLNVNAIIKEDNE